MIRPHPATAPLALLATLVVLLAPFAEMRVGAAQEQEPGVTRRYLADEPVAAPASDVSLTVSRVALAPADRTDSLLLAGPAVVTVETGAVKVWTRAGTSLDGALVTARIATIYARKQQSLSIPAGVRFRLRAIGCEPAKLLFVVLLPRGGPPNR